MSDNDIARRALQKCGFDENQFDILEKYCVFIDKHNLSREGLQIESMLFCLHMAIHTGWKSDYVDHYVREFVYTYFGDSIEEYKGEYSDGSQHEDCCNIKRQAHKTVEKKDGYVYIAKTESMPDLVKIGYTTQAIEKRMDQLSPRTSVPTPFSCVWYRVVEDCTRAERDIHDGLRDYRIGESEFFRIDSEMASVKCLDILMELGYVVR